MAKKKTEEAQEKTLENLILDKSEGKYHVVPLISSWALSLRRREEFRHLNQTDILEIAMRQVLGGEVSPEQIKAQAAQDASEAPAESNGAEKEKKK